MGHLPGDPATLAGNAKARWAMAHSRTVALRVEHHCGTIGRRTFQDHFYRRLGVARGVTFGLWCPRCRKTFTHRRSYGL